MAALLNYGEPQNLELFKNTLPNKLYWILFPINNLRDAADAAKRVLSKGKLDKQLSGQARATTSFMKVGNTSHSGKKVSFKVQDPIREQLENLTSMVYNMSMEKKENSKLFKPQIYQKRGRVQSRQNFGNRDRGRTFSSDRQNYRSNNKGRSQNRQCGNDSRRGNYRHQNYSRNDSRERGRQSFRSNNINRSRSPTARNNRRYNSPNASTSNSRVTTNIDRIRCFRCREYDHFANECPNVSTDDSDGYGSDRAALQLMTTGADVHDNFDTARLTEESDYLNL